MSAGGASLLTMCARWGPTAFGLSSGVLAVHDRPVPTSEHHLRPVILLVRWWWGATVTLLDEHLPCASSCVIEGQLHEDIWIAILIVVTSEGEVLLVLSVAGLLR